MRKKAFSIIAALLSLIFVVMAGGFKAAPAAKLTTEQIIPASNPSAVPAAAKSRNDTLVVGTGAWNGDFNPVLSSSKYDSWATSLVFDGGLMTNDESGNPAKWMADSYTISKDGKTYTFKIHKGIKFSNGDEVTAQDFQLSYLTIADPSYTGARMDACENIVGYEEYHKGYAKTIKGIKVIDNYTISFTEKTIKASALLQDFAYAPMDHTYYAYPKGKTKNLEALYNKAMGAGPYKLVENKMGQYITFERNMNYWKGAPKIAKLIMKKTGAANNIQELTTGGTDIDLIPTKPENIDMLKKPGFLSMHLTPNNGYGYIGLNLRLDKFSDKRVRQALAYGINRQGFIDAYYKGYAEVSNAPVSPVSWAYTTDINPYKYDPKKAASLLDAAGWKMAKDGWRYKGKEKFTINWLTYTDSKYVETLIPIMKSNLKDLGIDLIPELMEFSTESDKVYKERKFEMYNMAWSLSIDPDPSGIFSISQDVVGGFNSVGWRNPESEKLMKAGLVETNQAKRKAIYQKWVKLANDELPYIFLSQTKDMWVVSSRVQGAKFGPYTDWTYNIEKLTLTN